MVLGGVLHAADILGGVTDVCKANISQLYATKPSSDDEENLF
jgi:hypothetical protein